MFDYEAEYQRLRAAGGPGWAVVPQPDRALRLLNRLDQLDRAGIFPPPPACVLELGCGNARTALAMAERGHSVWGIDIAPTAIAWAREIFAEAGQTGDFQIGLASAMPRFSAGQFDAVIDGQCLHCLIGPDRTACLAEVRRILRPHGLFFVSSMVAPPKSAEAQARFDAGRGCLMRDGESYRTLKPLATLTEELATAGFAVKDQALGINPWWDHAMLACRRVARKQLSYLSL
ncbi:methyltransferase [Labrys miyagiensis]|uniref:Methyltransferase n=1 Tax=Labrys miyagiensis TaxID=346912 RepID=A0ABQ6CJV5_9HYPH|nr:methyltransferase domain-containing protein [Labrys miyagiensis]GLS20642.1 methyltransferase [Labrys miyagiensis]